jgi:hypothetical protein
MTLHPLARAAVVTGLVTLVAACGGNRGEGGWFKRLAGSPAKDEQPFGRTKDESTIWDLFSASDDPNTTVEVNKYLWTASLDILNFLPIESVDPFTGVIVTGYGTPRRSMCRIRRWMRDR